MDQNELVSVVIASYNAENTILETLDSVYNQTYPNLELVISDDCSKDRTVEVCQKWIEGHKERFANVQLMTTPVNQGVCLNANKGRFAASGEWQMGLASDDILLPNCVSDNMDYVQSRPDSSIVFSYMKVYNDEFIEGKCINEKKGPRNPDIFEKPLEIQLITMAYSAYVYMTTMFIKSDVFKELGGYSNTYAYEDWPFFIDILEKGYKIDLLDKVTYGYRVHESQSHSKGKLFNYSLTEKTIPFITERCFKYYSIRKKFAVKAQWQMEKFLYKTHLDNDTPLMSFLYRKTTAALFKFGNSSLKHIKSKK